MQSSKKFCDIFLDFIKNAIEQNVPKVFLQAIIEVPEGRNLLAARNLYRK